MDQYRAIPRHDVPKGLLDRRAETVWLLAGDQRTRAVRDEQES
jgi:hypothetical protein